ncbi:hypothetical protein [Dryocola sp. BD613]|uniref:hypothetical protein n=1 Tax=Dryocola sp. BD613 TaxID=3133272 RepID=UPI003F50AC3A
MLTELKKYIHKNDKAMIVINKLTLAYLKMIGAEFMTFADERLMNHSPVNYAEITHINTSTWQFTLQITSDFTEDGNFNYKRKNLLASEKKGSIFIIVDGKEMPT